MQVCVLGSGSKGNAVLFVAGDTRVLVDAGFSGRELARRLHLVGVPPERVDALVITHDHGDHTRGMGVFARRYGTPIHATEATLEASGRVLRGGEILRPYRPGVPFRVGAITVEPFLTVHDAADPVGLAVVDGREGLRVGVATDLGRPTAQIRHALARAHFLILEANHDEALLHEGPYPWRVKARIASSHGHLSNHAAARLAMDLLHPELLGIVLAHLSAECNTAELAHRVVSSALAKARYGGYLAVATQDEPTELIDLVRLRNQTGPAQLDLF